MKHLPFTTKLNVLFISLVALQLTSCDKDTSDTTQQEIVDETEIMENIYFPPVHSSEWETLSSSELDWDISKETELKNYLENQNTKAFIILKKGRIAKEWYFNGFDAYKTWYWASAGKTLTAFTMGQALAQELVNLNDATSNYLGNGWTSLTPEQELKITIKHQLSMTTGLNETEFTCVTPTCLTFTAEAGNRWAYHNGPYTLLQEVLTKATETDYNEFFTSQLKDKIGMDGFWLSTEEANNVYFSTARSMARFGLLIMNKGIWSDENLLRNESYFNAMTTTSQPWNAAYGYLWWLNGKENYMLPGSNTLYEGQLIPTAPKDLIAALGKNDQKIYVIPSHNLVIVRLGEAANAENFALSTFDVDLWYLLSEYMKIN
ncbi:serine hydrolase [Flavobacterium sp. ASW18X]|uniref:serine hydrolase domain-containing protein n=1 Tax=Flavobacterium sp. ASW18X TaxID=2572595 RepID=UPI0010AEA2DE|nr:serine hydrolase [Flavobacterium sp. ASW18X]TKD58944.1 serine hydrolase [Flavobacterium sp. ASW18X]